MAESTKTITDLNEVCGIVKDEDLSEKELTDETADTSFRTVRNIQILRVEGPISKGWSGVTGCCEQRTVDQNYAAAYVAWRTATIDEHRHLRYLRSGAGPGKGRCTYRDDTPWGGRSCRGTIAGQAWAEFLVPTR